MEHSGAPRAGLLPFYLKLYDDVLPRHRAGFEGFIATISRALEARGITVETAPVCCVAHEFEAVVSQFETKGVDCIVTVHLAYSPSLEAIGTFCQTRLPIVILDTTMDMDFGCGVSAERIMFNHGVHGVMDFASMLRRNARAFEIVADHVEDGTLFDRAAVLIRNAASSSPLLGNRVLRVGPAFAGMGDFCVDEAMLAERLGIQVNEVGIEVLDEAVLAVTEEEVTSEVAQDREQFNCDLSDEVHRRSTRVGLGLRHLLAEGEYQGFSVNFQVFDNPSRPANVMPFLEISKSMARGIGYAGEGDVLTAALVGALARTFGAVTFTEIFCPDWKGNSLFLSHMGEISPTVAAGRPRIFEKPFTFGGAGNPAVLTCAVRPGPAVFVNLAPGPNDTFSLIVAPVEVLAEDESLDPAMRDTIRAWIRPLMAVPEFLEAYSRAGGTHHSALVLGDHVEDVVALGRVSGLDVVLMK